MAEKKNIVDFMGELIDLAHQDSVTRPPRVFKSSRIEGFPLMSAIGAWGPVEEKENGDRKAHIFLPFLSNPKLPLQKHSGSSAIDSPIDSLASGLINPFNCKLSIAPKVNISSLEEGNFYVYLLALKPAVVRGATPIAYWDGAICSVFFGLQEKELTNLYWSMLAGGQSWFKSLFSAGDVKPSFSPTSATTSSTAASTPTPTSNPISAAAAAAK